jgi:hypothetical protein
VEQYLIDSAAKTFEGDVLRSWDKVAARMQLAAETHMDTLLASEVEQAARTLTHGTSWPTAMALLRLEESGATASCRPALMAGIRTALAGELPLAGAYSQFTWRVSVAHSQVERTVKNVPFAVGEVQFVLECHIVEHGSWVSFLLRLADHRARVPVVCQLVVHSCKPLFDDKVHEFKRVMGGDAATGQLKTAVVAASDYRVDGKVAVTVDIMV